jgi:hypothetical protein
MGQKRLLVDVDDLDMHHFYGVILKLNKVDQAVLNNRKYEEESTYNS